MAVSLGCSCLISGDPCEEQGTKQGSGTAAVAAVVLVLAVQLPHLRLPSLLVVTPSWLPVCSIASLLFTSPPRMIVPSSWSCPLVKLRAQFLCGQRDPAASPGDVLGRKSWRPARGLLSEAASSSGIFASRNRADAEAGCAEPPPSSPSPVFFFQLVKNCNEGARAMERTEQMYTLQKQLEFGKKKVRTGGSGGWVHPH